MLNLFRNSSIRSKTFAASVILLVCMLAFGMSAYHTISKAHIGLERLTSVTLPKQLLVTKLKDEIVATHVSIFRYVSWASNGVNSALLGELSDKVFAGITSTSAHLLDLAQLPDLQANELGIIHTLQAKWIQYEYVAKDTIDVGSVDAPMATMMLGMVDDEFKSVDQDLKAFLVVVTEETRSFAGELADEANANKRVLAVGGFIAMIVSLFTTLIVARSIIQPIQSITNLMQEVSSGKLDVKIVDLNRQDEIGKMVRAVATFRKTIERDNAQLKDREEELRIRNVHFNSALENMTQGLVMFDSDARLVLFNQRYSEMYEILSDHIKPGCSSSELFEYRRKFGLDDGDKHDIRAKTSSLLEHGESTQRFIKTNDDRIINVINWPMPGGGWVSTHEDITKRRRTEEKIATMARQDPLTMLSNRTSYLEDIENALVHLRQEQKTFAIFVLDLDQFKAVNDSLGHPVGDELLKMVGDRLREAVRETDTVARLGGDEFAVIQTAVIGNQKFAAQQLAERLLKTISMPYIIDGNEVVVGVSIGVALAPEDGDDADQLLKNADLALYKTKSDGRNDYRFFDAVIAEETRSRRVLARDLGDSLSRDELELHYQTIIDTSTNEPCVVEALARWKHPRLGMVSPEIFIPIAEETGLIIPLGEWFLRKACSDAASWPEHIKVAVNLSPVQFRSDKLMQAVTAALAGSGLAPERLEIEITESVLLQTDTENLAFLHDLQKLGVSVVLDDFGTGYSSLGYLQVFPFDKIKIDQSFVRDMVSRPDCAAIVGAVVGLGRSLDITTTAEGVETQEQYAMLRAAGCHQIQGYLFSKPCPLSELDLVSVEKHPVQKTNSIAKFAAG